MYSLPLYSSNWCCVCTVQSVLGGRLDEEETLNVLRNSVHIFHNIKRKHHRNTEIHSELVCDFEIVHHDCLFDK